MVGKGLNVSYVIQWNLSIPDTIGTQQNCPDYRGVLISEVHLYTNVIEPQPTVLIIEVS